MSQQVPSPTRCLQGVPALPQYYPNIHVQQTGTVSIIIAIICGYFTSFCHKNFQNILITTKLNMIRFRF